MQKRIRKTRRVLRKVRKSRNLRKAHRGGRLGMIPVGSSVSIQQDPYSARIFVDAETAEEVFEARNTYLL
jgi:hypothetical protein